MDTNKRHIVETRKKDYNSFKIPIRKRSNPRNKNLLSACCQPNVEEWQELNNN